MVELLVLERLVVVVLVRLTPTDDVVFVGSVGFVVVVGWVGIVVVDAVSPSVALITT